MNLNAEERDKLLNQLTKDLKLLVDTSKLFAQKMESVQRSTLTLLGMDTGETGTEAAAGTRATASSVSAGGSSGDFKSHLTTETISELLSKFSSFLQGAADPKEVIRSLEIMRDKLMGLYTGGFHPAFAEIGRAAREIKGLKKLEGEDKKALQEKVIDWRSRLVR